MVIPRRTMLAATLPTQEEWTEELFDKGPLIVSPKEDGIRLQVCGSIGYSGRQGKQLPNEYIQSFIQMQLSGAFLDGEIVCLDQNNERLPFADIIFPTGERISGIESLLMTRSGAPNFRYLVFDDLTHPFMSYSMRLMMAKNQIDFLHTRGLQKYIQMMPFWTAYCVKDLVLFEQRCVDSGYEGICVRHTTGPYKEGRSTLNERFLLKHKRFTDDEAYIIGMEPLYSEVEQCTKDTMGSLVCRSAKFDEEFNIGTGFTPQMRKWFWDHYESVCNPPSKCTYKYQPHGTRDRPRSPVFKNLRNSD